MSNKDFFVNYSFFWSRKKKKMNLIHSGFYFKMINALAFCIICFIIFIFCAFNLFFLHHFTFFCVKNSFLYWSQNAWFYFYSDLITLICIAVGIKQDQTAHRCSLILHCTLRHSVIKFFKRNHTQCHLSN